MAVDMKRSTKTAPVSLSTSYLTGSPFIDELVEAPWKLDADGMLAIPSGPGLGVSINPDAVERYTGERLGPAGKGA